MTITLVSLLAQESTTNSYPYEKEKKIVKLSKHIPLFAKTNTGYTAEKKESLNLQDWMLNPNEWSEDNNTSWTVESMDPEIKLEDWMLDPVAMTSANSLDVEESQDSTIELQDWMLNPEKMSVGKEASVSDDEKSLEPWMLDPTKW
jgi:hypothetical protein